MLRGPDRDGEPLRLLWLIDSLAAGGAESLALAFARAVDPVHVRLVVACVRSIAGNPLEAPLRSTGVRVVNLEARSLRDARAFLRLLRVLREERSELVHAHLAHACAWGSIASRIVRVPLVATLHVGPHEGPRLSRATWRAAISERLLATRATSILCVSEAVRAQHAARGRLPVERLVVAHNGVACEDFVLERAPAAASLRAEMGLEPDAVIASLVAVLREGKGHDVLLEAAPAIVERAPRTRFLLAGDGPLRPALEAEIARRGLGDVVRLVGHREDIPRLLAGSDLLVLPSLHDAFPTVLMEAMAAGLPVVASNVGGIPEIVTDGTTGLLVPPGHPPALADALTALVSSPQRREAMGAAGRARARSLFSMEAWLSRLAGHYAQAIGGPRGTLVAKALPLPVSERRA